MIPVEQYFLSIKIKIAFKSCRKFNVLANHNPKVLLSANADNSILVLNHMKHLTLLKKYYKTNQYFHERALIRGWVAVCERPPQPLQCLVTLCSPFSCPKKNKSRTKLQSI